MFYFFVLVAKKKPKLLVTYKRLGCAEELDTTPCPESAFIYNTVCLSRSKVSNADELCINPGFVDFYPMRVPCPIHIYFLCSLRLLVELTLVPAVERGRFQLPFCSFTTFF